MKHYPDFQATEADIAELLASQRVGRLVTVSETGAPRIGVHVFVHDGLTVEVHLANDDPQLADLRARPATFEVDDILSAAPSSWNHPENATHADQFYRMAALHGQFEIIADVDAIATHLRGIVARYQPGTSSTPVSAGHAYYEKAIQYISAARLVPSSVTSKFKLAQTTRPDARGRIVAGLESRGTDLDRRTLNAMRAAGSSATADDADE